ncbi:MAG: hypothetical protein HY319_24970 [Armatimonadetes bacterium]|nr:hypothetical protein [Armatimonadota bacterium]
MERITILGAGPLATAMGVLLARANWPIEGISSRDHSAALVSSLRIGCSAYPDPLEPVARSSLVLLALAQEEVAPEAARLAPALGEDTVVAHTCGGLGPDALGGRHGLALQPLQHVPDAAAGLERLPGSLFALEGPADAVRRGSELVRAIGGVPREVCSAGRAAYASGIEELLARPVPFDEAAEFLERWAQAE